MKPPTICSAGCVFLFKQRIQISELDVCIADHRARGFAKPDPAGGARLCETFGEDLSFVIADQLSQFHFQFPSTPRVICRRR